MAAIHELALQSPLPDQAVIMGEVPGRSGLLGDPTRSRRESEPRADSRALGICGTRRAAHASCGWRPWRAGRCSIPTRDATRKFRARCFSGGDWVIPHLNGLAYIEKPPLQYWATALSYRVLGVSEFSARLYTALTALATVALCGSWRAGSGALEAGWRAAAVLSGMFMFVVLGQLLTLDMSLTFYMTLESGRVFCWRSTRRRPRPPLTHARMDAAGVGWLPRLGVLTKGLVAAAIPAAVLILYSLSLA